MRGMNFDSKSKLALFRICLGKIEEEGSNQDILQKYFRIGHRRVTESEPLKDAEDRGGNAGRGTPECRVRSRTQGTRLCDLSGPSTESYFVEDFAGLA